VKKVSSVLLHVLLCSPPCSPPCSPLFSSMFSSVLLCSSLPLSVITLFRPNWLSIVFATQLSRSWDSRVCSHLWRGDSIQVQDPDLSGPGPQWTRTTVDSDLSGPPVAGHRGPVASRHAAQLLFELTGRLERQCVSNHEENGNAASVTHHLLHNNQNLLLSNIMFLYFFPSYLVNKFPNLL